MTVYSFCPKLIKEELKNVKLLNCLHIPKLDDARDFEHSGVKTHKNGARLIYENSNIR